MPRSLLEILLEKKDPTKSLIYKTSEQFYMELDNLEVFCLSVLSELKGIESFGGVNVEEFTTVRNTIKTQLEKIRKYKDEFKDYPWNDPTVQKALQGMVEDVQKAAADLKTAREDSLGKDDSYRIGNDYFINAEALREKATQKIFRIASMRDKEIKVDRQRSNTDLTENNEFDKNKVDIVAKKESPGKSETADDKAKREARDEKREVEAKRIKAGMFYYLSMILGRTQNQIKTAWGADLKDNPDKKADIDKNNAKIKEDRLELLKKAIPYMEGVTGRDYDENDPFSDKQYISDLIVLSSYTPGYANYKPEEDSEEKVEFTEEDIKKIEEEMKKRKTSIMAIVDKIIADNQGSDPVSKTIREEITLAKEDLDAVDPKTACELYSMRDLRTAKRELEGKIKEYGPSGMNVLDEEKVIKPLLEISKKIEDIFSYCLGKKYKS